MQVHTGEILAWAVNPDFNPNKYFDYDPIRTKNWSLVDVYQPGSVFKIITVSSALDAGVIDKDYTFDDPGFLQVGKWKIKNHHYNPNKPSVEKLNLQDLFAKSSNSFASHVALKLGAKDFYHYLRKFGIGQKTGIELDGETEGILRKYNQWDLADTATTGIGQGAISITPLQLIVAVNTIANHGYKVKPTIFKVDKQKFIKQEQKKEDEKNPPIVKSEIADHIVKLLTAAIAHNVTVKKTISGNIPNVQIAGKTGTSQKTTNSGSYSHTNTIASFVGFFPAQSPKYIALVVIDDPKAAGGWGDTVSGPLFNMVVSYMTSLY
jgi:cell division protein FtsI/penicillin-binding protein 2